MMPAALRRWLPVVLVLLPLLAPAQSPQPTPVSSKAAATLLGTRLDTLQALLDKVRDARGEPLRQVAMERHWSAMQDYMQESLKVTVRDPVPAGPRAVDCRLVGGSWRALSFPGQIRSDDYLGLMQGHLGRMRQDVLAIHAAPSPEALDTALQQHWRSNYEFLQRTRGLGWMFDSWAPSPGDSHLPAPDSEGAQLAQAFCTICHAVPHARLHTAKEWDGVMSTMAQHIVSSDSGIPMCVQVPTPPQLEAIRAYLSANGR